LLPFEQLAHGPVHPEGLLAIEIGLQTGRDFANQAAEAHKALQLGIVGHSRPPDELAAGNATVVLRATGGHRPGFEESGLPSSLLLWRSIGVRKILYDCCCAVTAMLRQAGTRRP
jgi:hypothetical protein